MENIVEMYVVQRRGRQWQPTPVILPGKFHGWRSLVGCSPWGRKESDTPEQLTHTHTHTQSREAVVYEDH